MTDCAYLFCQRGSFGFGALPSSEINYGYIGKRLWRIHQLMIRVVLIHPGPDTVVPINSLKMAM